MIPKRFLSIHEYQSFGLLEKYSVNVPKVKVAENPEEAVRSAESLGNRNIEPICRNE